MSSTVTAGVTVGRLSAEEQARIERWRDDPDAMRAEERTAEAERRAANRLWSAVMPQRALACSNSILLGRPVLVRQLDPAALRRATRGQPLPDPDSYVRVRPGHLDAIAERGPFG